MKDGNDVMLVKKDIEYIREAVTENKETIRCGLKELSCKIDDLSSIYVTKNEFMPVKLISYGMISSITLAVLGAVITLVLK